MISRIKSSLFFLDRSILRLGKFSVCSVGFMEGEFFKRFNLT